TWRRPADRPRRGPVPAHRSLPHPRHPRTRPAARHRGATRGIDGMSNTKQGDGLQHLVTLRQREVDSLTSDMAAKEKVRQRVVTTLARIESLCEGSGASGAASPVYSLNCAKIGRASCRDRVWYATDGLWQ